MDAASASATPEHRLRPDLPLIVLVAALLFAGSSAHTWYSARTAAEVATGAIEDRALRQADELAHAARSLATDERAAGLDMLLDTATAGDRGARRVLLLDRDARVVADAGADARATPAASLVPPSAPGLHVARTGNRLVVWRSLGEPAGSWLRLEYAMDGVWELHARVARASLLLGLASTALGVLVLMAYLKRTWPAGRDRAGQGRSLEIESLGQALREVSSKVREQEAVLTAVTKRLEAVLQHVIDGIITLDEHGRVESANLAAAHVFQYAPEELVGLPFDRLVPDFPLAHQDERDADPAPPLASGLRLEVSALRKDGSAFPLTLGLTEMRLDGRRLLVGTVRDITEQKRLDRMKTDFIAAVSHELRTPLTAIHGSLELLAGGEVEGISGKGRELAHIAYKNSGRLTRLVNDILDFEAMEAGTMRFEVSVVELMPIVHEAIEVSRPQARQKQVELALTAAATGARVMVDPERLQRAIANLLANAIRLSPPSDRVEIAVTPVEGRLRIAVSDRGPGIPEEYRPHLFEKFVQIDGADFRYKAGAGLGLAIVRTIVERLGGTVDYTSEPDVRTTFVIELPEVARA
ncbi:histidine kinase [Sulfurifustis variabilis]|uniref:histidine kinase n=2 Tax=Sulfurifustis variabilis TaxID=1675686 RepID=A0A1C7AFP9_9GAMM|nr:histidine kinase [Sulfurifustis variabilis]